MKIHYILSAMLALASAGTPALATPPSAPTQVRINDLPAPVGTGGAVYFGWQVNDSDPDEIQSRFQLLVASSEAALATDTADVWDSGPVTSRLQNHVPYSGPALDSDRRYHWKVRTWDKAGNPGPYSTPAAFSVGLLDNTVWSGAFWVRRDSTEADDYTLYRKQFTLPAKPVVRATAYVSGTHKYALHLNGRLVGKGPAYHYPQYQYYNAFDITGLVQPGGANQFALFNHWFGDGQGRPAGARGVILKAIIHYADGTTIELGTDSTWRQSRATAWILGQPGRNPGEGIGYVECIDARELRPDWTSTSFDDSRWSPVTVLGPHPVAPWTGALTPDLTRIEESVISPAKISDLGNGKFLVDLGKVYPGIPRIHFSGGTPGTSVTLRGGFVLNAAGEIPEGTMTQATLMEYRAILSGGEFTFEPVEYLGMRYVQIDNSPMPVTPANFEFVVRHTRLDANASAFESSDPALNTAWDFMKHSLFTCAQEQFLDTPTREKGGFLGDSVVQSTVAMPVLGERALTRRTLHEFLHSMDQYWSSPANRGRINAVYPNGDGARDIPDFTQAYLTWVWAYYMETGDHAFLAENYDHLKAVADYQHRHVDASTGLVARLTGGKGPYEFGIVDWPAPMRYGYDMATDARTVVNAWAYAGSDILAKIAAELDHSADRDTYRARAEGLLSAINSRLLGANGLYIDGLHAGGAPSTHVSQHANMFPLALGIVPAPNRPAVIAEVKNQHMSVGMVTVSWLIRALGESDQGTHLVELFTNPAWDGWARCLARGASSTWESWHSDTIADESLSHAWGAAGMEGYYRYILGIRPLKPQYEKVLIQPLDFAGKLAWAGGRIATDRGPISVHWIHSADSYTLRLSLPVNVTACVALPGGGTAQTAVTLDGAPAPFTTEGDTLVLNGIGSGEHIITRTR